jgi:hypothetical protein
MRSFQLSEGLFMHISLNSSFVLDYAVVHGDLEVISSPVYATIHGYFEVISSPSFKISVLI